MKLKITYLLLFLTSFAFSQIITTSPLFPTANDTVTIIYDATQGNGGLVNATEIYAHTGAITSKSTNMSDWKYVKTGWTQNSTITKLESLGENKWQIKFHIKSYYNVPADEEITHLAFVFRNADGTRTGRTTDGGDIFVQIYKSGLNIQLLSPTEIPAFTSINKPINIKAVSHLADSSFLYINNNLVLALDADTIQYNYASQNPEIVSAKVIAQDASGAQKSVYFDLVTNPELSIKPLPDNTRRGINYDKNSVTLVLEAPYKKFTYVIGEFNNWQPNLDYFMNLTPDSTTYWLTIPHLESKEYQFQYLVNGNMRIADPYSEKILDPRHDSYIDAQTYPNLPEYPGGQTTEIVSTFQPNKTEFEWTNTNFERPQKQNLVIYELLLRDFITEHTFQALVDSLSYFKRLGINAIELLPVNEFFGNSSWGYNPHFHFAVDKYYGPAFFLQKFIDEAHNQGIAIILDMVLNHAYDQCSLVRLYADDIARNPWFNVTSSNPVFSWGFDFDHESEFTQNYVDRVLEYWINEFNVDGYRLDFTKGFTNTPGDGWAYDAKRIKLLRRLATKLWQTDSDAYLILEHFTDNREEKELADFGMMIWGNMNGAYNEATMGYTENEKSNLEGGSYKHRGWNQPNLVTYMESHDEERLMAKNLQYGNSVSGYDVKNLSTALDRIKLAATFFFTIPGPKMIWQFGELGYDVSIDEGGRTSPKPIRWDYLQNPDRKELFDTFSQLAHLKRHPAFSSTNYSLNVKDAVKSITVQHDSMNIVVIGNFDVVRKEMSQEFPNDGTWYDFFTKDEIRIENGRKTFNLNAGEYRLYTNKQVIVESDSSEKKSSDETRLGLNYPNPFTNETTITFSLKKDQLVKLDIFNSNGQLVRNLFSGPKEGGEHNLSFNFSGFASGIYFIKLETGRKNLVRKVLHFN